MDRFVTPGARELEYLACIVERAAMVRTQAGWSQWSQGLLQMLLPHQSMVCLRSGGDGRPAQALCLHPPGMDAARMAQLCGLAQRLALACRGGLPWALPEVADDDVDGGDGAAAPTPLRRDLAKLAPGATLLHGTGALASGAVWFILFGMPRGREAVSRYYLELLLPSLYLLSQRLAAQPLAEPLKEALAEPLTGREREILHCLQQGKINADIGVMLGISARTVKNHVYNIYRKLAVQNRVQAVARAAALSLTGTPS